MRVFYSDHFTVTLPEGHRFPMEKYRLLRDHLVNHEILGQNELSEPLRDSREVLHLAHDPDYVASFLAGELDSRHMRKVGFPWSEAFVLRVLATVSGALSAADEALVSGFSGNLAGGTHHASRAQGEGFCVFNDLATVAMDLVARGLERIVILDLDVHHGNGNVEILGAVPEVSIISVHGERNYPFQKPSSCLDIGLPDGTDDSTYLKVVEQVLEIVHRLKPQIILYQAGVDALHSDSLGKLAMTHRGLERRDEFVLGYAKRHDVPISLALGGGYAKPIADSVLAYANTYRVARRVFAE